jgi:hypothetical protein
MSATVVPISSRESYKNESHLTISGTIRPIGYWPAPPFSAVEQYGILEYSTFIKLYEPITVESKMTTPKKFQLFFKLLHCALFLLSQWSFV